MQSGRQRFCQKSLTVPGALPAIEDIRREVDGAEKLATGYKRNWNGSPEKVVTRPADAGEKPRHMKALCC